MNATTSSRSSSVVTTHTYTCSTRELDSFYSALSKVGKPVILSIVPKFCDAYIPLQSKGVLPQPISDLFKEDYLALSYLDLLQKCEDVFNTLAIKLKKLEKNKRSIKFKNLVPTTSSKDYGIEVYMRSMN